MIVEIHSSYIIENKAEVMGGGIAWFGKIPQISENNKYYKNFAMYGPDISSYPIKLGVDIYDKSSSVLIYSSINNSIMGKIMNVSSGKPLQYYIIIYVLDYYDCPVKSISGL